MALILLTSLILNIILLVILWAQRRYQYWKRRGVTQLDPEFVFGDVKKLILLQDSVANCFVGFYNKFKSMGLKHGGIYTIFRPTWIPVDLELIKRIMQTDYKYFTSHGQYFHQKDNLSLNLFSLDGVDYWKNLRSRLSPTFTSGKLKMMFDTFVEKTVVLKKISDDFAEKNKPIDAKDVLSRFTTDIIGSVVFGIDCNSLNEPQDNDFRKYGNKILEPRLMQIWCEGFLPHSILPYIGYKSGGGAGVQNFFKNLVKETVEQREKNNIYRKDFMHLLIQLKNRGEITEDGNISKTKSKGDFHITEEELIAQTFLFFIAGYETSATTSTFALYELSRNPDIQEKVRQEINEVLEKYDNKVTYDALMEMTYLEKVIKETLRKYPPLAAIPRECTKNYTVPGTNVIIEKGTLVQISAMAIQRDPEYYPNPDEFNPNNFDKDQIAERPDFAWIPFGEGPRICLGMRFGILQSKIGLLTIVKNYRCSVNKKTLDPLEFENGCIITTAKGDIWLNIEKI